MCEPSANQCRLREYYLAQGIPLLTTKKVREDNYATERSDCGLLTV